MEVVHAVFRREDRGWSAHCPEAPGYRAFAESLDEVVRLAHEGIPFFLEREVTVADNFQAIPAATNAAVTANAFSVVRSATTGGGVISNATAADPATVPSPVPAVRSAVPKVLAQQVA